MTDRQKLIAAILMAVPALLAACTAWVQAKAKQEEARAAWAGYGDYVTDQLHRDEALLKALQDCAWHQGGSEVLSATRIRREGPAGPLGDGSTGERETRPASPLDATPQAQTVLDDVARSRGWEPGGTKQ